MSKVQLELLFRWRFWWG